MYMLLDAVCFFFVETFEPDPFQTRQFLDSLEVTVLFCGYLPGQKVITDRSVDFTLLYDGGRHWSFRRPDAIWS